MNKEIKDRLDKLENELKESKNEIHSLKSSVSLTIERGIRNLLSRFTRRQIILGSVIVLLSISIIGIAGTVTKTYTFSSGDVVSASKINTNFDILYTLLNGNLDDSNISGISGSKITSGTVAAARLDNLSGSKITSGTVAAARIDNLDGSKITSGTVAAARIDNLSASIITSGVFNNSTIPKPADSIVFYPTPSVQANLGGRSGADALCLRYLDNESISMFNNSCSNVRAVISIDANDEIRDMASNYSIPTDRDLRSNTGIKFGTSWDNFTNRNYWHPIATVLGGMSDGGTWNYKFWYGTDVYGVISNSTCSNFTSVSGTTQVVTGNSVEGSIPSEDCNGQYKLLCICF
jgi:hypothetical protein